MSEPDYRDLYYKMVGLYDAAKIIHEAELAAKDAEIARLREFLEEMAADSDFHIIWDEIKSLLEARE